jgi:hypothetical protein
MSAQTIGSCPHCGAPLRIDADAVACATAGCRWADVVLRDAAGADSRHGVYADDLARAKPRRRPYRKTARRRSR